MSASLNTIRLLLGLTGCGSRDVKDVPETNKEKTESGYE